jgi:hypothetical protein
MSKRDQSIHYRGALPDLVSDSPPLSFFEFWPGWLFYFPMKLYAIYLGLRFGGFTLPSVANPSIYAGGFVGEKKSDIFELLPDETAQYFAEYAMFEKTCDDGSNCENDIQRAKDLIDENKLEFPFVIKPDQGERGAGVQVVNAMDDVERYVRDFPYGEKIFMQQMYDYPSEVGLFYVRRPGEQSGKIFSLTFKYFPEVVGDGVSTLKELILADPRAGRIPEIYLPRHEDKLDRVLDKGERLRLTFSGSHSKGAIFKNGNPFITDAMQKKWDALARTIPELYFCRFDIRCHGLEDLETLENLKIIEVNGAGAEATHIWDSRMSLWEAYKTLMTQYRMMFEIGALNVERGYEPLPFFEVLKSIDRNKELREKYPQTH